MQYLMPTDQVKPPQPDPIKLMDAQSKMISAQAQMHTAEQIDVKDQRLAAMNAGKLNVEQQKVAVSALDHDRSQDRMDIETAVKLDIARREMELEEKMRPEELKGIVSPNV